MAFIPINPEILKVGDPITKDLLDLIKNNFDNHEQRLNQNETTGGSVFILNSAFNLSGLDDQVIFYFKAIQDFSVADFRGQLFDKHSVNSGILSIDLQKASNTNNSNFNSILTTPVSFDFSSDASYPEKIATINPSLASFEAGDVLRLRVLSTPANFGEKILLAIGAE
jgi:hypothetical protein